MQGIEFGDAAYEGNQGEEEEGRAGTEYHVGCHGLRLGLLVCAFWRRTTRGPTGQHYLNGPEIHKIFSRSILADMRGCRICIVESRNKDCGERCRRGGGVAFWAVTCDCDGAVEGYYEEEDLVEEGVDFGVSLLEGGENSYFLFGWHLESVAMDRWGNRQWWRGLKAEPGQL